LPHPIRWTPAPSWTGQGGAVRHAGGAAGRTGPAAARGGARPVRGERIAGAGGTVARARYCLFVGRAGRWRRSSARTSTASRSPRGGPDPGGRDAAGDQAAAPGEDELADQRASTGWCCRSALPAAGRRAPAPVLREFFRRLAHEPLVAWMRPSSCATRPREPSRRTCPVAGGGTRDLGNITFRFMRRPSQAPIEREPGLSIHAQAVDFRPGCRAGRGQAAARSRPRSAVGGWLRARHAAGHRADRHRRGTNAHPERIVELFRRTRQVGMQFGVVLVKQGPHWIEVATFRTDVNYTDGRRPELVEFTNAREDAQRRDFTITGCFTTPSSITDRLRGRAGGPAKKGDPGHRRARAPLRRGPPADAAGCAVRVQVRLCHRARHGGRRSRAGPATGADQRRADPEELEKMFRRRAAPSRCGKCRPGPRALLMAQ